MRAIRDHVPLAPLTTLGVGGPARHFLVAHDVVELQAGLAWAAARALPVLVLGGGSNLLVSDAGFPGLVIRLALRGVEARTRGADVELDVAAGERWDALVNRAVDAGWAGLECLTGIPGDVGAAPIQNIGAYGREVAELVRAVRVLDPADGAVTEMPPEACGFGYRTSRFKRAPGRFVVLGLRLGLEAGGRAEVRYAELQRALGPGDHGLAAVRAAVRALRRGKSMLLDDPTDPNRRSAGSFFLNPVVPPSVADAAAAVTPDPMPRWPTDGGVKLSAAWLIERAGFPRGYGEGPAGLSTRHTLALVNRGGATAADLLALARRIRAGVRATFGVTLEPEPVLVGYDADPFDLPA